MSTKNTMKHNAVITTMLLLVLFTFSACASVTPDDQTSKDSNITENGASTGCSDYDNTSTPEFFNDLGKTLDELKYLYYFFGTQSGDAEKAMNEYEDQLECSGFVTTACILFPDMEDEMSFEDFFSLIGVDDYEYLGEDTTAAGWLRFMYNGMEVMVNTNEAASGGGWNFTGAEIVKHNAPVSIVDTEIFNTNQDLADAVMFD